MFNEKFLSIHIPKTGQEALLEKEIKKIGKQREKRINKKWDEELTRYQGVESAIQDIERHRKIELSMTLTLLLSGNYISYYPYSIECWILKNECSYSKKYTEKY